MDTATLLGSFGPFVLIMVAFYFLFIRPQKKREKAIKDMRENLKVGDEILTIGGIKGKIVLIKEDYIVIESSANKTNIELMKWGINSVVTDKEDLKA
ncbi:preprotein translocase subunit YajC [Peptoniphilus catoniae]|uniref:preprotein translocase subunit YajC n=1 Tax=Peptoniphilus catoniae TaxID=1660341 RepID=UPI0010FE38F3|nr:preprotein translocase subunit YajC [Peptoniphilus catoniae]